MTTENSKTQKPKKKAAVKRTAAKPRMPQGKRRNFRKAVHPIDTMISQYKAEEKKKKHAGGRPTAITLEVIRKLERVFAMDGTVEQACKLAGIARSTYYEYLKIDTKFSDRIEALKQMPFMLSLETLTRSIAHDSTDAKWFLERRDKKRYGQKIDLGGGKLPNIEEKTKDQIEAAKRSLEMINVKVRDITHTFILPEANPETHDSENS